MPLGNGHRGRNVPRDVDLAFWGRNVRAWRDHRVLTQKELAAAVTRKLRHTISQNCVSQWEGGRRRPTDVQRIAIAEVLEVPALWLFPYQASLPDGNGTHGRTVTEH